MFSLEIKNCSDKEFPAFIRNNLAINSNLKIDKIFPYLGLNNISEAIDSKFDISDVQLNKIIHLALKKFTTNFRNNDHSLYDLKNYELYKIGHILYTCDALAKKLENNVGIVQKNGKPYLSEPILSFDSKTPLYKRGTDVFKMAKTLLDVGAKYCRVELISSEEIKHELKNLKVVFSSDGINGAWDLATMSMRGVKSCMRWEARQSQSLIGTIVDPYCGMVYITNGAKTAYGSKMLFRALVRVVVPTSMEFDKEVKPSLMVDRLYSCFYKTTPAEHNKLDNQIRKIFVEFLKKKLPGVDILDSASQKVENYYLLPKPPSLDLLSKEQQSYRDTNLPYTYDCFNGDLYKSFNIVSQAKSKNKKITSTKKMTPTKLKIKKRV